MLSSFYHASLAGSALLSNSLPTQTFLSAAMNSSGLVNHWCNHRVSVPLAVIFSSQCSPVTETFYFRQQQPPQQTELEVVPGRESLSGYDHSQVNQQGVWLLLAFVVLHYLNYLLLGLEKWPHETDLRLLRVWRGRCSALGFAGSGCLILIHCCGILPTMPTSMLSALNGPTVPIKYAGVQRAARPLAWKVFACKALSCSPCWLRDR